MIRIRPVLLTLLTIAFLLPAGSMVTAQDNNSVLSQKRQKLLDRFKTADEAERNQILRELIQLKLEEERRKGRTLDTHNRLPSADEISRHFEPSTIDSMLNPVPISNSLGLGGALAEDGELSDRDIQKLIGLAAKDGITEEEKEQLRQVAEVYEDVMSDETKEQLAKATGEEDTEYKLNSEKDTWTSTYWPMAGSGIDDKGRATKNLWAEGGAMTKLDKVIESRTGTPGNAYETESRPALNWLIDEPKGFWIANSTLSEKDAERTTGVDLNRNGKIDPDVEWDFIDSRGNFGEDGKMDGTMGVGWWGRCNNVGVAGTLFDEPKRAVTLDGQTFSAEEIKGLLAVYSDTVNEAKGTEFVGNRFDDQPDFLVTKDGKQLRGIIENAGELNFNSTDMTRANNPRLADYMILDSKGIGEDKEIRFRDLTTGEVTTYKSSEIELVAKEDKSQDTEAVVFHNTMTEWLADGRAGVLEMDPSSHVWNYNFESADVKESKTAPYWASDREKLAGYNGPPGDGELTYVDATVKYDGGGKTQRYKYWLEKDENGNVVNSGWASKNVDFMWRANESEVDWSREVPGHPSLNGEILKELYEKSTAEEAPDAAEVSDDNE
ncbi:MAG: hypothetical protein QF752_00095 [Planctomycetota bacterium]|jgi:hypothetical protein|nr:hypothetical protein [Planctomycetota bacterium]